MYHSFVGAYKFKGKKMHRSLSYETQQERSNGPLNAVQPMNVAKTIYWFHLISAWQKAEHWCIQSTMLATMHYFQEASSQIFLYDEQTDRWKKIKGWIKEELTGW